MADMIKSEWALKASKHSPTKIHWSVNKTEILDGICLKIYLNLDMTSFSKNQTKSEKQWDDKMTAHPIIEATISTLSERMPSHMVTGTAWSTALKNAPWEKADKQTEHNLNLCFCIQHHKTTKFDQAVNTAKAAFCGLLTWISGKKLEIDNYMHSSSGRLLHSKRQKNRKDRPRVTQCRVRQQIGSYWHL